MHLQNIEANFLKTTAQSSLTICLKSTPVYIKTCAHSYMISCCGQHSIATQNTVWSLNMHFTWKDKQRTCKDLQDHVTVPGNTRKGPCFSFSCRTWYVGRTEEANEWVKTKYEYTRVDTFVAINTYITVFWVTIPCCRQGSTRTEKHFLTY